MRETIKMKFSVHTFNNNYSITYRDTYIYTFQIEYLGY